jgi:hypothetical protein
MGRCRAGSHHPCALTGRPAQPERGAAGARRQSAYSHCFCGFAGSRGRAGQKFAIGEYTVGEDLRPTQPRNALAVSRRGNLALADDFGELGPGDRVLVNIPLAPFREGQDTLAAAAERFLRGG